MDNYFKLELRLINNFQSYSKEMVTQKNKAFKKLIEHRKKYQLDPLMITFNPQQIADITQQLGNYVRKFSPISYQLFEQRENNSLSATEIDLLNKKIVSLKTDGAISALQHTKIIKGEGAFCCVENSMATIYLQRLKNLYDYFDYLHEIAHYLLYFDGHEFWYQELFANIIEVHLARSIFPTTILQKYRAFKIAAFLQAMVNYSFERKIYQEQNLGNYDRHYRTCLTKYFPMFCDMDQFSNCWQDDQSIINFPLESGEYGHALMAANLILMRMPLVGNMDHLGRLIKEYLPFIQQTLGPGPTTFSRVPGEEKKT